VPVDIFSGIICALAPWVGPSKAPMGAPRPTARNPPVFLTRRPHIDDGTVGCFSEAVRRPVSPTHAEIRSYLEMRLGCQCGANRNAMDDQPQADIMGMVPEGITEM